MKDNELIAEFMGVGKHYEAQSSNQFNQYHKSWDWLMPVVDKCFQYGELHNSYREQVIESLSGVIDIEDTFKAVVEFIKDYEKKAYKIDEKKNVIAGVDFSESINQLNNL